MPAPDPKSQPGAHQKGAAAPKNTEATNSEAGAVLKVGSVLEGQIVAQQTNGRYVVATTAPTQRLTDVKISGIFSLFLGFSCRTSLEVGTNVAVLYGTGGATILTTIPGDLPDIVAGGTRSAVWGDTTGQATGGETDVPEDMIDGEFDFTNLHSVGLQFLTSIMMMKAGDLAKV